MSETWFSIDILPLAGGNAFFNGFFAVNSVTTTVTRFYNSINTSENIYINNGFDGENSLFNITPPYSFSHGGTNITSLPALSAPGIAFFNLYDTGGIGFIDINGHVPGGSQYTFVFNPIKNPFPPPINYYGRSLFTDNALVYYKPHSLAPGGVGGIRNYRSKGRRT